MSPAKRSGAEAKSDAFGARVIVCEPLSTPSAKIARVLPILVNVNVCDWSKFVMPESAVSSSSPLSRNATLPSEKRSAVGPVYGGDVSAERTNRTPLSDPGGK